MKIRRYEKEKDIYKTRCHLRNTKIFIGSPDCLLCKYNCDNDWLLQTVNCDYPNPPKKSATKYIGTDFLNEIKNKNKHEYESKKFHKTFKNAIIFTILFLIFLVLIWNVI